VQPRLSIGRVSVANNWKKLKKNVKVKGVCWFYNLEISEAEYASG
jgi:hypothetical protein